MCLEVEIACALFCRFEDDRVDEPHEGSVRNAVVLSQCDRFIFPALDSVVLDECVALPGLLGAWYLPELNLDVVA